MKEAITASNSGVVVRPSSMFPASAGAALRGCDPRGHTIPIADHKSSAFDPPGMLGDSFARTLGRTRINTTGNEPANPIQKTRSIQNEVRNRPGADIELHDYAIVEVTASAAG